MEITTRKTAITAGLVRYFTGKECKYGHIAERLTSNGVCLACTALNKSAKDKAYRLRHIDKIRAKDRIRSPRPVRDKNIRQAQKRRHYEKHRASILKKCACYRASNKERLRDYFKQYKQENNGAVNALNKRRDLAKKQRTPAWLTDDDFWLMKEIYELAALRSKMSGFKWHVDHIVPLQGETVSGLHVPNNLQVIPYLDNILKRNSYG